ncbi:hypothetical protein M433DRAFT_149286 [Acidomyces richmondensis BFW]|nr:MAG: hypothetical protein FE78DRAFT_88697 [Acidomyces sp. 'richmondensis']KYG50052.1 hypothetical protein M433DRAFT_149286 [Acidomyces richmondensis BFW]
MDGTPRLRSAFPTTPQTRRPTSRLSGTPSKLRGGEKLPEIPVLQPSAAYQSQEPLIPESLIDAPSQRLYAVTIWVALWSWKMYDFYNLQESEEQSLWLFMKWVALDGLWLFGLPAFRIPWLEWSSATMTLLFSIHALADGMMMFRIPIPISAGFAALGRSIWGAYELALNEHKVNPRTIEFNESLILGRQIIHILPEGSAILNANGAPFCIDSNSPEVKLPITINSTNPISMQLLRIDLDTHANETIQISKSQIKKMHKEASRLTSYSDKPNEPKILYYSVKKTGLYSLHKVIDESNLEVSRKRTDHTVVVPCPKANLLPAQSDRCKGELSNVELEAIGTPPMRVKYRRIVNQQTQESTFESIQPENFNSPLLKVNHENGVVLPKKIDVEWAKTQTVHVPLSEGMGTAGRWFYSLLEVTDGFGNKIKYTDHDREISERYPSKLGRLHQAITVHERPTINLHGCTPQNPLKVAKDNWAYLPVEYHSTSTGRGAILGTPYHIQYMFTPEGEISANGEHSARAKKIDVTMKDINQLPSIQAAGLYTITGVSTDFCRGDVYEPASCLLQNPPEPTMTVDAEEISDKCAGSPIGLRVNINLTGTPPFDIHYTVHKNGERHHISPVERVNGMRSQLELTPRDAGEYTYQFTSISDAVYKDRRLGLQLKQTVKPAASASIKHVRKKVACIDERISFVVELHGEGPFALAYEIIHNGKRKEFEVADINAREITLETEQLHDGGDYTIALVSIRDRMGCMEVLKDEAKISVRHQIPRASFGQIDGRRAVEALQGKKVQLPLRLAGEAPWSVSYLDANGLEHQLRVTQPNDWIMVEQEGKYQLTKVEDGFCPGQVDDMAKDFHVNWVPRPELQLPVGELTKSSPRSFTRAPVCEGEEDAIDLLFQGASPYRVRYEQSAKLNHGTMAPKQKDLRVAGKSGSLRMETAQAGTYDYKLYELEDANYAHSLDHFKPISIRQEVHPRPSAAFVNSGKTYSYCSVESEGEEVIPIQLSGEPPFDIEVEVKHHGTGRPEALSITNIKGTSHNIRIPHSKLQRGKSAVALRRISDSRGCSRLLDSTTARVQISVHDAPTITPLEGHEDFCVGDRINFVLSGQPPFNVLYDFEGQKRKAVSSSTTFRRLAEKPGIFTVTGITDAASNCLARTNITRYIHGMPSVRVSHGKESYVDIHEGGEADILLDFGGVPPFEFTYTRSSNTEKGGKKKGVILDMRHEVSQQHSMRIRATEEGTYEVVAIRDRYCSYAKPGIDVNRKKSQKLLDFR